MILKYLQKGDVIEIKKGMTVYTGADEHKPIKTVIGSVIHLHDSQETFDTGVFIGDYAVIQAGSTGQGSGYDGSVDAAVIYPDGYKIICKKLKDGKYDSEGTEIHFYQSGCFSVVIQPSQIQPVRRINLEI